MDFSDAPAESVLTANTPESAFERKAAQWALIKARVDTQTSLLNKLRDDMTVDLREFGVQDEKGSYIIELPRPLSVADKKFKGMKLERYTTQGMDEDEAEAIARDLDSEATGKGNDAVIYDRLFPLVRQFDPQEAYVLYQEGRLTEDHLDRIFPEKEGFRFVRVAA
ncbi:hypothetical protein [Streptomyces sp. RTd22]|uniref:hypothetical protein n=1 Tax=Streptomyces sp. RTd22 TaxID=1841249 RepID=UPI0007C598F3|nr:hypothetical protein [Streptomyces sp. RTd22]